MGQQLDAQQRALDDIERYARLQEMIKQAVAEALPPTALTEEEHMWLRAAIKREAQRAESRRKILESAVIWAIPIFIVFEFRAIVEFIVNHLPSKP